MSIAFATLTSDSNLLACELLRLKDRVALDEPGSHHRFGVGYYQQDSVLLRRFSQGGAPASLVGLVPDSGSEAVLYYGGPPHPTHHGEEAAQPLRFRHWLFAHLGTVHEFQKARPQLLASLPEFLKRHLHGETDHEAAFALFLKSLREMGRTDDRHLSAALGAQLLSRTVRALQQLSAEAGSNRPSPLSLVATNGRMLLAARSSEQPLYYALLEGSATCERCNLDPKLPSTESARRAHRRRRTVAIASHPKDPAGWIELPTQTALAVDASLNVQRLPL